MLCRFADHGLILAVYSSLFYFSLFLHFLLYQYITAFVAGCAATITSTKHLPIHPASDDVSSKIILYAQPYDISANGFYFHNLEEYQQKSFTLRNSGGLPVEEFEIQFIDGNDLDADLVKALNVHQGNFDAFLTASDEWDESQKIRVIIANAVTASIRVRMIRLDLAR